MSVENEFDIEKLLIHVQIEYLKSEIMYMKEHYMGQYLDRYGKEHDMDYRFKNISSEYEELISNCKTDEEQLHIYKELFIECYDLTYESIIEEPFVKIHKEPLLYEKCMCGTESVLIVEDDEPEYNVLSIRE